MQKQTKGATRMFDETKESIFLKKHFKDYYLKHFVDTVPEVNKREFGFGIHKRKIANRNLAFSSPEAMNKFLRVKNPLFFSYSNSYYSDPDKQPMTNKGYLKSDIIYEFDADEISSTCEKKGDEWICKKTFGKESLVKEIGNKQWFLGASLEQSKKQVFRLLDFLQDDFNFNLENVSVNFSGKAGYHVHIRKEEIQNLNKKARIELVDYLTAYGMYYDNLGFELEKNLSCPKGKGKWGKRINQGIKEFFEKDVKEISAITKMQPTKIRNFLKSKQDLFNSLDKGFLLPFSPRKNKDFWKPILEFVIQTYASPIDRQTSIDLHKIIRVPETLHGETGFLAKLLTIEELEKFDPFKDAIVFGEELVKINVSETPEFKLKENSFGPFKNEVVEVPLYCAVYLVGKGVAKLV
jgi:DNA primase small subunit